MTIDSKDIEMLGVASIGQPRTGKTERLKLLSYEYPCVFYYDANEDISGHRSYNKLPSGTPVVRSLKKLMYFYRHKKKKRIVYVPRNKESVEELEAWLKLVYNIGMARYKKKFKYPTIIFIDEIWNYTTQHHIPKGLQTLLREGRKYNILLYWTAQRITRLYSDVQSLNDIFYIFQLFANDVKKIRELATEIDDQMLKSLGQFECIKLNVLTREIWKVDKDGNESEIPASGGEHSKGLQIKENENTDRKNE